MTTPHEHWDELAAGFALDALEPAEEVELLTHLDECELCRDALRGHRLVAAQLAALADDDDLAPPSWAAIRTGIVGTQPSHDVVSIAAHRQARMRRPWLVGAIAASCVIIAGVVTAVVVNTGGTSAREAAISSCRADAACHVVELNRGTSERAVVIVRNGSARLVPTSLASPSPNRVYALWQLPRTGKPTLLAQPVPRQSASSAPLALPYGDTTGFALSLEPAGPKAGSPTDVVAIGSAT
jgi:hypothetical protein